MKCCLSIILTTITATLGLVASIELVTNTDPFVLLSFLLPFMAYKTIPSIKGASK